jgi:multidrug resistance efflux pump
MWVRLAQRFPVRIRLIDVPEDELISAGMTCTVILNDASKPHIGTGVKHVMSGLF